MMTERFQKLESLFSAARALPLDERVTFIERECGQDEALRDELLALLDADTAPHGMLDQPLVVQAPGDDDLNVSDAALPETIGPYRVLGLIGVGGMGVVYRAEQHNPKRIVAVKVLQSTMLNDRMVRRFELEAQTLARLQHPGIAQVFEAGAAPTEAGRRPYFAMELIDGEPLLVDATRRGLDTRERIARLISVCEAVEHAHQKGVIHRDLKPGNILVDRSGQPKVLDFGVARLVDSDVQVTQQTDIGQLVGTLPYMSPEQIAGDPGDIDARCDVYALGVIMYELLSGELPLAVQDKSITVAAEMIRDVDAPTLSTHDRRFRGDLETIVAKALEKRKERRYQSVAEFRADLERYLNEEPIAARPASAMYQMSKFARRHRAMVIGAAGIVLAMTAGLITSTVLYIDADRARVRAQTEAAKATAVNDFMQGMLEPVHPYLSPGREVTVRDALESAAARLDDEFAEQPEVRASLHATIGGLYFLLGEFNRAETHLQAAVDAGPVLSMPERVRAHVGLSRVLRSVARLDQGERMLNQAEALVDPGAADAPALRADIMLARAELHTEQRRWGEALALYDRSLDDAERRFGPRSERALMIRSLIAQITRQQGNLDDAERMYRSIVSDDGAIDDVRPVMLRSWTGLAHIVRLKGDLDEAVRINADVVESTARILGPDHPDTLVAEGNLAAAIMRHGQEHEAEQRLRSVLERAAGAFGESHPQIAVWRSFIAECLRQQGLITEAVREADEALAMVESETGPNRDEAARLVIEATLVRCLLEAGRLTEALEAAKANLDGCRVFYGDAHFETLSSQHKYAQALHVTGRSDEAMPLVEAAHEGLVRIFGERSSTVLDQLHEMSRMLMERGELDQAAAYLEQGLQHCRETFGDRHEYTTVLLAARAELVGRQGRLREAADLMRSVLDIRLETLGERNIRSIVAMNELSQVLQALDELDEAERLLRRSLELRIERFGERDPRTLTAMNNLGLLLGRLDRDEESVAMLERNLELRREVLGPDHASVLSTMNNLALGYADLGRLADAERMHRDVFTAREKLYGPEHRRTLIALSNYADDVERQDRLDQAERLYADLLDRAGRALSDRDWHFGFYCGQYGACLMELGRLDEAETYLEQALNILSAALGESHRRTESIRRHLQRLASLREGTTGDGGRQTP